NGGRDAAARGAAVHSLLEWCQANGWREPPPDLARLHASAAGLDAEAAPELLPPLRAWLGSELLASRVAPAARTRAEVPFLLELDSALLRGSIDLLVETDGRPPLVLDYKTDRLDGASPADRANRYGVQRDLYALAVAEASGATEVEVAYVFLERAEEPVVQLLGEAEIAAGRQRLRESIARIAHGEFAAAPMERRDAALCDGCPALLRLCAGPENRTASI
ncbi:MAG TPA: PD-(D/E)XK nuclease family protein, partial [Solirubrobacterales bacterium]